MLGKSVPKSVLVLKRVKMDVVDVLAMGRDNQRSLFDGIMGGLHRFDSIVKGLRTVRWETIDCPQAS